MIEKSFIKECLEEVLDERDRIDRETHSKDHEFVRTLREEYEQRKARRERIKERIAGSLLLSALIGLLGYCGHLVVEFIDKVRHLKNPGG